jgi:hypothetical protein
MSGASWLATEARSVDAQRSASPAGSAASPTPQSRNSNGQRSPRTAALIAIRGCAAPARGGAFAEEYGYRSRPLRTGVIIATCNRAAPAL